jgi:hypothetical protein
MMFDKFLAKLSRKKERTVTISSPRLQSSSVGIRASLVAEEAEEELESGASTPVSFVAPLPRDVLRQQEEGEEDRVGASPTLASPCRPTLDFGSRPALSSLSQSLDSVAEARVWKDRCESFRCKNEELVKDNAGLRVEVGRVKRLEEEVERLENENRWLRAKVKTMRKVIEGR